MNVEDESKAFEKWASPLGFDLEPMYMEEGYRDRRTDDSFTAWLARARLDGGWVKCTDKLPPLDVPVWVIEGGNPYMAALIEVDSEEGYGYSWGRVYGEPYLHDGVWSAPAIEYDDDYNPALWMPLPSPPKEDGE